MEQTTELMVVHPNNSFEVHGKNTKGTERHAA